MKKTVAAVLMTLFLAGCFATPFGGINPFSSDLHAQASAIAAAGHMTESTLAASPFLLTRWSRITDPGKTVRVYIEGDGLAWVTRNRISKNPTPTNPVALRLAAQDDHANVVYLARPCQYTGRVDNMACDETYWTRGKTSHDVINAYMAALDQIRDETKAPAFELVGYSGGAAVAVLVASQRSDVAAIRTVAGNISYGAFDALHGTTPASESIDPMTAVNAVMNIPQIHFIGADDDVITPAIYAAWKDGAPQKECIQSATVPGVRHEKGWENRWPELLALPAPGC